MVDDGSLDNSAQIIKKWQKKYPENISYIKKENGGQASARNLGLKYVTTEWVTFIDPDDFVDKRYFEELELFQEKHQNKNFAMLGANLHFYFEKGKRFVDSHPLKYKFKNNENIVSMKNMGNNIHLSAPTALFKMAIINKYQIKFKDIKPNFEDAHFLNNYLLKIDSQSESHIAFIKKSIYFYRKREDGGSTLDGVWQKKEQFKDVLRDGCLDLFKLANNQPKEYIQRVVLYHLIWYFGYLLNREERLSALNNKEKKEFFLLIKEIFTYIDIETINGFTLAGCWFYHKVGMIGMMKQERLASQIVYVEEYDAIKKLVKLRYLSYFKSSSIVTVDNREVLPTSHKIQTHTFVDEKFVDEYILWIPLEGNCRLNIFVDSMPTRISFGGKQYHNDVNSNEIIAHFKNSKKIDINSLPLSVKMCRKSYQLPYFEKKFKDAWILMDRDTQADDNAEHLYRYIQKNHSNINIFFVLRKTSHDWDRLEKDGFNLIAFGSLEHKASLIHAKHMIASDATKIHSDYLDKKYYQDLVNYKFTFLQHGITKDDLSTWLNAKEINCFITAVKREYDSIVSDFNKYKFSNKEVVLTGFPRHDKLIEENILNTKEILIMPTWRNGLKDGDFKGEIEEQEYFTEWSKFLNSELLKHITKTDGYKVVFNPHPNMKAYMDYLNIPNHIEIYEGEKKSIQKLFQNSELLITDYSSVALEMGLLNKPTLYYQFDHKTFFSGGHSYTKGYYDYEEDGFGSICYTYEVLIDELTKYLSGDLDKRFYKRMEKFYLYKDKTNSQRVFNAIEDLYSSRTDEIDYVKLEAYLDKKYKAKEWKSVESLSEKILENEFDETIKLKWIESKIELGRYTEVEEALELFNKSSKYSYLSKRLNDIKGLMDSLSFSEQKKLVNGDITDLFLSLRFENLKELFVNKDFKVLLVAFELLNQDKLEEGQKSEFYTMWGDTLFAMDRYDETIKILDKIESESVNILIIKAKSHFKIRNWQQSFDLWESIYKQYETYNREEVLKYIILSLYYLKDKNKLLKYEEEFLMDRFLNGRENDISTLNYLHENEPLCIK